MIPGRLGVALLLAVVMWGAYATPAGALDLDPEDYLELDYNPVTFDKTGIQGNETFHAVVSGRVICHQDLPAILPVREAEIDTQVIARHAVSGAEVTLNTGYNIKIKPFPDDAGDYVDISQTVPLQFPSGASSGEYTVIGRITRAKVKFLIGSMDVTEFLPGEHTMGTVTCNIPTETPAPAPPAPTSPEPSTEENTPSPAPAASESPSPTPSPAPASEPGPGSAPSPAVTPTPTQEPEQVVPWWVGPVVFAAIAITVLNIAWFVSQWLKKHVH